MQIFESHIEAIKQHENVSFSDYNLSVMKVGRNIDFIE